MGNNPPNPTRPQKPPDLLNRPLDLSTYSDGYELLFFQNSGFRAGNGFPFFYRVSTWPIRPMFKNKKTLTLTLPLISHFLSLSLSPSRPLHHQRFVIKISTRLPLLPHGLSTTSGPPFRSGITSFFSFTASPPPLVRFDLWFNLVFRLIFFYLVFRLDFLFGKFVVLICFFVFFLGNLWFWLGFSG